LLRCNKVGAVLEITITEITCDFTKGMFNSTILELRFNPGEVVHYITSQLDETQKAPHT